MKTINSFIPVKSGFVIIFMLLFTLTFAQPKLKKDQQLNNNNFPEYSDIKLDTITLKPEEVIDEETILGICVIGGGKVSPNIRFAVKNNMVISWDSKQEKNSILKAISLNTNNYKTLSYSVTVPVNGLNKGQCESTGKNTIEYWEGNDGPKQAIIYFPCRVQKL